MPSGVNKLNTRKITVYDILFLTAAAAIFFFAVFYPPVRGIADQGDFERVMRPMGLDFPDDYSFYSWSERFFPTHFTKEDMLLYIPRLLFIVPATAFMLPSFITRIFCIGEFDVRALAVIIFVWYTLSCFFILRRVKIKNAVLRIVFIAFFIIVFYNGVNLTLFNSLYGQSVMLASFASLVCAGLYLFDSTKTASAPKILLFTLASCLILGSKLQCFVFAPFLAAAVIFIGFKSNRRVLCALCAVIIMWHGVGGYFINGMNTGRATRYNSVFYGILKDSPNPEKDLADFGLSTELLPDAGKHAFLDDSEYICPPNSKEAEEMFYSKISNTAIVKFYFTHPIRLFKAMELTAHEAFYNRIDLGTFEKKYGFEPYLSSYRFTLWENFRSHLPRTLMFIMPVWLLFIAFTVLKQKDRYFLPMLFIFIIGAVQFAMPYIGNGAADISKQLFMFNTIFDFGLAIAVYSLLKCLDNFFQKRY